MHLENLRPAKGAVKNKKRVGRGPGSGNGETAGRGHKGQRSRSGSSLRPGFEGGQMPLQRRLPKRGFTNIFRRAFSCVNVGALAKRFEAGSVVGPEDLRRLGLVKNRPQEVKILGEGELGTKLTVRAHAFSEAARTKIEQAGGQCEVLPG